MSSEPAGTFESQQSPAPPAPLPHPPGEAQRRALVLFFIFATASFFLILFVVLYVRWARAKEPNAVLIVAATPAFDKADIIVEGVALPSPYKVTVGERFGRTIPFYLDRGSYTLRIAYLGRTIFSSELPELENDKVLRLDLKPLEYLMPSPATASASSPPPG